jgi:G3E family GTPase
VVPVVLLTGFLGSGKTTLLNRLLAARRQGGDQASGGKLAILVNELGSIGIDGSLLPDGAARQVELPGGCICCTLDENLEQSLRELLAAAPDLELVIIETTGVAEPLPILWTLTGEGLAGQIRVAAVVTVVDALEHERHRPLAPAVDAQVEHADILLVSKLDALEPDGARARLAVLEPALRELCPSAVLLAEPDPDRSAAALLGLLADPALDSSAARRRMAPRIAAHAHAHAERAAPAAHQIEAVALPIEGTLDFEELTSQLEELPPSYVRIKGIARAVDLSTGSAEVRWIAFHRVGARVSAEPLAVGGEQPAPRLVALGFDLDLGRLAACLRAAVVPSSS